jgi:nitroimidazol reductase NimA-like FMN-containing flavoprotein (pyridoxamine 5'-phosphate oxidase superfamily)
MTDHRSVELRPADVDDFLGTGGAGVLALARDDESYAVPVSYGYDAESRAFYVRLAFTPESEKQRFVARGGPASLVVHGDTDDGWHSVVARGPIEEVTETALDSTVAEAIRRVDIPFVTIYDRPRRDLTLRVYRLRPDELTGRKERTEPNS